MRLKQRSLWNGCAFGVIIESQHKSKDAKNHLNFRSGFVQNDGRAKSGRPSTASENDPGGLRLPGRDA